MPVCGNYLFFELPKKIVLNPKDGFFFPRWQFPAIINIINHPLGEIP